jgi:coenzyme F420 hydrogenase subunit delta
MTTGEPFTKRTLVLGCGNVLYGDDGFGPAVADLLLERYAIPNDAAVYNLGLSTRAFLFDLLLAPCHPQRIVVVDAMDRGARRPGEIFEVPLDSLTREKVDDFSFHQGPTSNMLAELRDLCGVDVVILSCRPRRIPLEMERGLSPPVVEAVPKTAWLIHERYLGGGEGHHSKPPFGPRYRWRVRSPGLPARK